MLRLEVAVVLVAVAAGALWIEQGHRVVIDAPAAAAIPVAAAACPDTDAVPYSASCLEYLDFSQATPPPPQVVVSLAAPAPCPENDRMPYSASCIAFLKGATETGMNWRVTEPPASTPAPQ